MVSSCGEAKLELVPVTKSGNRHESVQFVEQFVKRVVDFSSQYGCDTNYPYTAYNITGNPSKFPDYGDFPNAFVMRTYGKWWDEAPSRCLDFMPQNNDPIVSHDYIDLEYSKEVFPVRVSIYETFNPGSVVAIWARDEAGQWLRLWSGPPQIVSHKARIFSPPLHLCNFKTKTLRLEFNHSLLDYYTELDAVLLIGTSELIVPHAESQMQSLSCLLKELGETNHNNEDFHNLTPNYLRVDQDLKSLKSTLHKHCVLYKSKQQEKVPKGRLTTKLRCHYIPPIEEAFNSLQKFLQEDFPRLIRDINLPSTVDLIDPELENQSLSQTNNTCGSFSSLPDETVLKILKNLDLKSLSRCSQLNRYFNNIVCDALLYTSLNLRPYWHCLDTTVLNSFITKCQYLQCLDLSWCGNYDMISSTSFVNFLQCSGKNLIRLRLNCCRFVNDTVIQEISQTCKHLKELCLRNCTEISSSGFSTLESLENLERLELYRTSVETATLCSILRKNHQIRHLNLAGMHNRLDMDVVSTEIAASCSKIESIDFWKAQSLTADGIRALSNCSGLKEIDFGWCSGVGALGDSLRVFLSSCKNLEKVFLTYMRNLTDRDLEPLFSCRRLKQLDLLGARTLSPDICVELLCRLQLEMIDLSFCDNISDMKILEWRRLYPHISIKRSSQISR
ncbi:hypothetical protein QAD02_000298 [Eretmocerus hayati]|uniref:Uncharacterized protein n=1 Tax=Eretmocerus hayati TaxID=131215 RepID=A0ACC2NCY2_9HYME|nr:hypothetical protein QAD02_000298 [Eretmocerus hayati]